MNRRKKTHIIQKFIVNFKRTLEKSRTSSVYFVVNKLKDIPRLLEHVLPKRYYKFTLGLELSGDCALKKYLMDFTVQNSSGICLFVACFFLFLGLRLLRDLRKYLSFFNCIYYYQGTFCVVKGFLQYETTDTFSTCICLAKSIVNLLELVLVL